MVDADALAETAETAARAVAGRLTAAFRSRVDVAYKRDFHDPVTEHDRAAEAVIREVICSRHPGSVVVGEEDGERGSGRLRWYVDPIDGTANFAHGLAFFCTSVAAAVAGEVVAGVVYDPVRDDAFVATPSGAYRNGVPLASGGARTDAEALLLTGYPSPRELTEPGVLEGFGALVGAFGTVRRPGSAALSLAHVAAGWADVAYGTSVRPWDVAAGSLLVQRAGGCYLPVGGGADVPPWRAPGYLAAVRGFDLERSVLARVVAGQPGR